MRNKTSRQEWQIICPFFRCHSYVEIGCEGITDDSSIRLIFGDRAAREIQERVFCKENYENCELYRAIHEKYEGD